MATFFINVGPPVRETVGSLRERYVESRAWSGSLDYELIEDHEEVANGVFRTTLADGTRIWVNKTRQDWEGETTRVAAGGHTVLRPARSGSP